uniref:Uncharacterized protein n=1 Tax=Anguilla anguilla TaxID=7936 RepID=A0A0E9VX36_ANGAN
MHSISPLLFPHSSFLLSSLSSHLFSSRLPSSPLLTCPLLSRVLCSLFCLWG